MIGELIDETKDYSSSPILDSSTSSGESTLVDGEESCDSDSEQFTTSPSLSGVHDSEHDGDEETERERRRRRRRGERSDRGDRNERTEEVILEGERGRERVNENVVEENTENNNVGEEFNGENGGRMFIGSGWWFLALLLFVQLYQSGTHVSLNYLLSMYII